MEPAAGERGAAHGPLWTETPTRSCRASQRGLLQGGPVEGGPAWLGLGVRYLYGNFLANFSCILALLFRPWWDFLGAFGSITEGGYTGVRPSAGAGREAGGASQDRNSKASQTAHGDRVPGRVVSPPVLSTLLHKACSGVSVCVCACTRALVHACVQLYAKHGSESPPQSKGPRLTGPAGPRCAHPPQRHPPPLQPSRGHLGSLWAVWGHGRGTLRRRAAPCCLQGLLPGAGLD